MKKFEYRTEVVDNFEPTDEAVKRWNRWGQDGWEVLQCFGTEDKARVWMKREIIE